MCQFILGKDSLSSLTNATTMEGTYVQIPQALDLGFSSRLGVVQLLVDSDKVIHLPRGRRVEFQESCLEFCVKLSLLWR